MANEMKIFDNGLIPVYETSTGEKVVDARELHKFMEVGKDFSNWIKDRIQKYEFVENSDYIKLTNSGERLNSGFQSRIDYVFKLEPAKEIAMVENNAKGREVRKYFIAIENKLKQQALDLSQLTPELQMFNQLFTALAQSQIATKQLTTEVTSIKNSLDHVKNTLAERDEDWREWINNMFNKTVMNRGGAKSLYAEMRVDSYSLLNQRAGCDLKRRQENIKKRLMESGATKTKINNVTMLDVIEEDIKLKEIYNSIIKEMSIKYSGI